MGSRMKRRIPVCIRQVGIRPGGQQGFHLRLEGRDPTGLIDD